MNLTSARELTVKELLGEHIDLVIAASGYERRATFVAKKIRSLKSEKRIALGFMDRPVLNRHKNDESFSKMGYELIPAEGHSDEVIRKVLREYLREVGKNSVKVVLDYSSMTRVWYAGAIEFLRGFDSSVSEVDVYFAYTPSVFARAQLPGPNMYMGPIQGFCGLSLPDKGTALLIGLGYEQQRALGLVEYVEPAETFLLFANPALDHRFVKEVERNNAEVLGAVKESNILTYPLGDLGTTASILTSLCLSLSENYRVILAPLGPKPFTLLCLLLATRYQKFDVWRVSAGEKGPPYHRPPLDRILICKTTFSRGVA